jgi:peroxiredoxin
LAEIAVGNEAPDFTLKDESNQEVRLSDLRGAPVVLVFYTADFSGICANEMCGYRDDYSAFEAKGARVFGISRDTIFAHKAFKESLGLQFPLLADPKGDVARVYGAWNEGLALAERLTVVVDGDGVIRYVTHNQIPNPRDHKEALAALG